MARDSFGRRGERVSVVLAAAVGAFTFGAQAPAAAHARMQESELAAEVRTYRIPSGTIGMALNRLAEENGVQLVFLAGLTRNAKTGGLKGDYTLGAALDELLTGTGLTYRLAKGEREVFIVLAQNDAVRNDAGAEALPPIDVGAETQQVKPGRRGYGGAGAGQDPYNTTYQLPNASTGTKTDTPVMNTPLNVQTITQQVLKDRQVITLDDAVRNVSGVTVTGGAWGFGTSFTNINLRGFPASTFYRDGTRLAADGGGGVNAFINQQFANVASLEILKGPAAMLYGLVEPGGIINVITKEPLNAPYYSVQQQIGSFDLYRTSVDATGPLAKDGSLLYRLNMSYESNGAPLGSPVDLVRSESLFFAPVLKLNVDASTWVKFEAEYNANRPDGFISAAPTLDGRFLDIPRTRNYAERAHQRFETTFAAITWNHEFDKDWSIKQQFAYRHQDADFDLVFPRPPIQVGSDVLVDRRRFHGVESMTYVSTNTDIVGHFATFGAEHTLLAGGDVYLKTNNDYQYYCPALPPAGSMIDFWYPIHPGTPGVFPTRPCTSLNSRQDTAGVYLQDQVELPYDVHLLAGARWQYINQTYAYGSSSFDLQPQQPLTADAVTPRFGLLWRPESWVSLYSSYSENFGPTTSYVYPGIATPPTNARSWEAGVKLEFFDGRLQTTADYYDLTKTNIATNDIVHPGFSLVTGEARSKGVELDIRGELLPGWSVIASYANQDVRVTKSNNGDEGQRLPHIPRNMASLWTTYEFQQDMLKGLKIGGGVTYNDKRPIEDLSGGLTLPSGATLNLSPYLRPLSAYATIDLMGAYSFEVEGKKVTAQLNIGNLLDTTYYREGIGTAFASPLAPGLSEGFRRYGAPRTFRGSLKVEF